MKTNMYCVFDSKAAVYGVPFFMVNDAMAIRSFGDLANDDRTLVGKHPEDFTLYRVGYFDDSTGVSQSCEPIAMVTASAMVRVVNGVVKAEIVR